MITGVAPRSRGERKGQASSRQESAWTVEQIRDRIADAADTLRRLPKPAGLERNLQSPWPDTLKDWLAYGWDRTQVRRAVPSPQAITRLDEVLDWVSVKYLTVPQRMVLWARAEHLSWSRIAFLDAQIGKGRTARQLQNIRNDAEARILNRLNGTPQRLVIPPPIPPACAGVGQAPPQAGSASRTKAIRIGRTGSGST